MPHSTLLYLHGVALLVLPEGGGQFWLAGDGGQLSPEQQGLCVGLGPSCQAGESVCSGDKGEEGGL